MVRSELTESQITDRWRTRTNKDAAEKLIRAAWHPLHADKDVAALDGRPFEIEQTTQMARDLPSIAAFSGLLRFMNSK